MQSEVATVPPIPLYFHSTLIAEFCWQLTKLETVLFVYQFSEFIYLCFLPRIRLPQTNIGVPLHTFINLELLANTILLLPSVDVVWLPADRGDDQPRAAVARCGRDVMVCTPLRETCDVMKDTRRGYDPDVTVATRRKNLAHSTINWNANNRNKVRLGYVFADYEDLFKILESKTAEERMSK